MAEEAFAAEMRRRAAIQLFLAEPEPPVYSFNAMRAADAPEATRRKRPWVRNQRARETLTRARRAVDD